MRVLALVVAALFFIGFGTYFTYTKRLEAERQRREAYAASASQRPGPADPEKRTSDKAEQELEFIHARITSLATVKDGILAIGLGPMARSFVIHPELSPDAEALATFAREARKAGTQVHATTWIRERVSKGDKGAGGTEWPFVIVRLAATRDPRAKDERPTPRRSDGR